MGRKIDLRDSKGAIVEPKERLEQQIGDRYYYIPKVEEAACPHQIPPTPSDFTDREAELKELMEKFEGGAQIIGLRGIGGVGKTTLAYKLAEALRDGFPDGQSW